MSASLIVQSLTEYATDMEAEYDDLHIESPDTLAVMLAAVREARAGLDVLAKRIEADLLANAGEKRFTVEGLGEVEILRNTKRTKWDSEALTRKLVAYALDERELNTETGEYEPDWQAVARVLSECARPSWRLTPLRARGIQVDEYCTESENGWSVKLPGRAGVL